MKNNIAYVFYGIVSTTSPTLSSIVKYLDKNSIDKIKLFYSLTENFFYSYLPFPVILHLSSLFSESLSFSSMRESRSCSGYAT